MSWFRRWVWLWPELVFGCGFMSSLFSVVDVLVRDFGLYEQQIHFNNMFLFSTATTTTTTASIP